MAPLVVTGTEAALGATGTLFSGRDFWLSQRLPMRGHFVNQIRSNGGRVVMAEKMAHYLIVDHMRNDTLPGGISYTFIETCIKTGELVAPEDHAIGPKKGTPREIGSLQPTKSKRTPFTAGDDKILYEWVRGFAEAGGPTQGNEIYKQLEQKYPHHTWQSWRDRWVTNLQHKRPATVPANPPPSPQTDQQIQEEMDERRQSDGEQSRGAEKKATESGRLEPSEASHKSAETEQTQGMARFKATTGRTARKSAASSRAIVTKASTDAIETQFTKFDYMELYTNVSYIRAVSVADYEEGWEAWAQNTDHSASQWREFFEKKVVLDWKQHTAEGVVKEKEARFKAELDANKESQRQETQQNVNEQLAQAPGTQSSRKEVRFQVEDKSSQADKATSPTTPNATKRSLPRADAEQAQQTSPKRIKSSTVDLPRQITPKGTAAVVEVELSEDDASSVVEEETTYVDLFEEHGQDQRRAKATDQSRNSVMVSRKGQSPPLFVSDHEDVDGHTQDVREPPFSQPEVDLNVPDPEEFDDEDDDDHDEVDAANVQIGSLASTPRRNGESDPFIEYPSENNTPENGRRKDGNALPIRSPKTTPRKAYNTQAILDTQSQGLDLNIPSPADLSDVEADNGSGPGPDTKAPRNRALRSPSIASTVSEFMMTDAEVESMYKKLRSMNFSFAEAEKIVIATSSYLTLTLQVAERFKTEKQIPNDVAGVWTAEDDEDLEGGDARGLQRLEEKHGAGRVDERREYVDTMRSQGWTRRGGKWMMT